MKAGKLRQLQKLAKLQGIQTSYVDVQGTLKEASVQTLEAMLRVMGVCLDNDHHLQEVVQRSTVERWSRYVDPVIVAWDRRPPVISVRLPASFKGREITCRLSYEDGGVEQWAIAVRRLRVEETVAVDGKDFISVQLPLRTPLPWGYHQLEIETEKDLFHSMIISAPTRSYSEPGAGKRWGVFLPLYALHSERSWGAGDFGDWQNLIDWTGSMGGSVISTLPLTASLLDKPFEPSPYSPASRLFWNEFYLCLDQVPELHECAEARRMIRTASFQKALKNFRKDPLVDYKEQMALKREVLQALCQCFFARRSDRQQRFRQFVCEHPRVEDYARFRAVVEKRGASWHTWPLSMKNGHLQMGDYSERVKRYHLFVQWLAHEQMRAVAEKCYATGVKLYLDLPLGVNPDSYDVWREQEIFALGSSAGAPPDPFFTNGQDWGFPPLIPTKLREQNYRYLIDFLRFQMQIAGALRIDHVMGLHRLYWVPHGLPASQGAYVSYPAEELYAILCLESHRNRTVIVGENLGTVPPEVNSSMTRHHLRRMFVVQYEQRPDPKEALSAPPAQSVASLNTHDMPTFAAHWRGLDIVDRHDLGLLSAADVKREKQQRQVMKNALVAFLKRKGWLKSKTVNSAAVAKACLSYLAESDAEILLVNLEDLWQELEPQNCPGTCSERVNWKRKAKLSLEEIRASKPLKEILAMIDELRKTEEGAAKESEKPQSFKRGMAPKGTLKQSGGAGPYQPKERSREANKSSRSRRWR